MSADSQKGINAVQQCALENQRVPNAIVFVQQ